MTRVGIGSEESGVGVRWEVILNIGRYFRLLCLSCIPSRQEQWPDSSPILVSGKVFFLGHRFKYVKPICESVSVS